jgi:hypothetical protein
VCPESKIILLKSNWKSDFLRIITFQFRVFWCPCNQLVTINPKPY